MTDPPELVPPLGGYPELRSFQMAQPACAVTVRFCGRNIEKRSRTLATLRDALLPKLLPGELRVPA